MRLDAKCSLWVPYGFVPIITAVDDLPDDDDYNDFLYVPFFGKELAKSCALDVQQAMHATHSVHLERHASHECWSAVAKAYKDFNAKAS